MIKSYNVDYNDGSKDKKFRSPKRYKKLEPFYCKECNRAWQPLRDYTNIADYLIGFPKIGCTIRICKNCNKKGKNNGTT